MNEEFAEGINSKCDGNKDWFGLKKKLPNVASEVCAYTKGKPRQNEEDRKRYCEAEKMLKD